MQIIGIASSVLALPGRLRAAPGALSADEIVKRVRNLVAQMTLDEKIAMMALAVKPHSPWSTGRAVLHQ